MSRRETACELWFGRRYTSFWLYRSELSDRTLCVQARFLSAPRNSSRWARVAPEHVNEAKILYFNFY